MTLIQGLNGNGEELRDAFVEHEAVNLDCSHDGRTRQEFADECDINILLQQYERTGVLNHFNNGAPQYLDVSDVPDLQTALDVVSRAQTAFMTLPAAVRRDFDNDPVKFVEFAEAPENLEQMRKWGLAAPEKPADAVSPAPVGVPSGGPAPAPAAPSAEKSAGG